MDRRTWAAAVGVALAVGGGCSRTPSGPPVGPGKPAVTPPVPADDRRASNAGPATRRGVAAPAAAATRPAPSPAPSVAAAPQTRPAAATRPVAVTRPATIPVAAAPPATQRVAAAAEVSEDAPAERRAFAEAVEQMELLRREVGELELDAGERREVDGLFDAAASAGSVLRAEFDAGRVPAADRRAAFLQLLRDTESKVRTVVGPERSIQLAAFRQTARGGGERFVARVRAAVRTLAPRHEPLTPEQAKGVEGVLEGVRRAVEQLPDRDAANFDADRAVRQRVQALIDDTRGKLASVLTPAQMAQVARQVPSLAKPPASGPTTRAGGVIPSP